MLALKNPVTDLLQLGHFEYVILDINFKLKIEYALTSPLSLGSAE